MKLKALALIMATTLMTVLLPLGSAGGPTQPPVDVSTLYVGEIGWGPVHADPVRAYDTRSEELILNCYDRLISFGSPVTNYIGTWDVEEQYWEFEPSLSSNVPTRQEVIWTFADTGLNPTDPTGYWFQSTPPDAFWYRIEGWVDNSPDAIFGPGDVLYIGVYIEPYVDFAYCLGIHTVHTIEYVVLDHVTVHYFYYDFNIRTDVINFVDETGAVVDTFDSADVEYSFERGLAQDQYGSPMWMFYKPFFDQMNSDWLEAGGMDASTASRFMSLLIEDLIEWNEEIFRIYVGLPFSDMSFKQIICGTWASIVSQQWCISKGCWNGNLFEDLNGNQIMDWYETQRHQASPIDNVDPANYAGTGPYRVTSTVISVIMQRNPGYWRGWPACQKKSYLEYVDIEYLDWNTMRDMFEACQLDIIEVPRPYVPELTDEFGNPVNPAKKTIKYIWPSLMLDSVFFGYNVNPLSPAIYTGLLPDGIPPDFFSNIHVRKAFAWAFDHAKYLNDAWRNEGICRESPDIAGLVPDYYTLGPDPPYTYDYNLAQVESELKQAMFTQGAETKSVWDWGGFHLDMFYNAGNEERRIACEMIAAAFASISPPPNYPDFHVNIHALDWPTFIGWMEDRMMPVFVAGWQGDYADADNFKRSFMHSQGFFPYYQGYTSVTLDSKDLLIDMAVKTPDGPLRGDMYGDLDAIYLIDLPSFPIAQPQGRKWMKYWVKGWYYNALYGGSLQAFQGTCDYYYKMYKEDTCWADVSGTTPGRSDGVCNMRDVGYIAGHFGAKAPNPIAIPPAPIYDPRWAPGTYGCGGCDVYGDRRVDMRDIAFAASHFLHAAQP